MASKYPNLFKPIRIRGIEFKNRVMLPPHSPNLCSHDGLVTDKFVDYFRAFARGGASIMYVGNSSIDITECRDEERQIDIAHPRGILPLSTFAEMGKEYGCHASLEVNHSGKDNPYETVGHLPFSSSAIPGDTEKMHAALEGRAVRIPVEMDQAKIDGTVMKYAAACYNMKLAGMDVALLHGGHGNLIGQFTSPHHNKRGDKYGGSIENRARFAVEVAEKVRELCGEDFVIDYRISADEIIEDGMRFEETLKLMKILKEHGVDMFNVSCGLHSEGMFAYMKYFCQNYTMARGFNVHWAEKIKDHFHGDIILSAVGSIVNPDLAEEYLSKGFCDFVAMNRALMADTDFPKKAAQNRPEDIRPCIRCNACLHRLGTHGSVGPREMNCAVNPMLGVAWRFREGRLPAAPERKRVAVIGGGPAGLTAMFTGAARGHDVTLYEKNSRVGGRIIQACAPSAKVDMKDYLKWLEAQTGKILEAGAARVLLGTEATPDMIEAEGYDAVIIAIGAELLLPDVPGVDKPNVFPAAEALTEYRQRVGARVVIVGAGGIGMESAADFHDEGKEIRIIDMKDPPDIARSGPPLSLLEERGIEIEYNTKLVGVTDTGVTVEDKYGNISEIEADSVLLATGMKANSELADSFRHCAPETECIVVGDAFAVGGDIAMAVNPAFHAILSL